MTADNETTPFTLVSTSVASLVAAVITFPAESWRVQWAEKTLRYWNPEEEHVVVNRKLRLFTPLIRLSFNELAGHCLSSGIATTASNHTVASTSDLERQFLAGAIAGVSQALLFTPFEAWRANQTMKTEKALTGKWQYWLYSQVLRGGSIDPEERRARAIQGLGLRAAREVVFNVTFFPLFHVLRQGFHDNANKRGNHRENWMNLTASGVIAGAICGVICTPIDIGIAYMLNSRERWSFWSGKKIHAVPLRILSRGLILQAFCFGPAFGAVAAIYEMT
jgi:hypothetical protein